MTPSEFEGRMRRAATDLRDVRSLMQRIGLIAEGNAKKLAPVKTGNLRRTITSTATERAAIVGASAAYAIYVHDGTRYMPARPFLADGIAASRDQIIAEVEKFGGQVLQLVAGG